MDNERQVQISYVIDTVALRGSETFTMLNTSIFNAVHDSKIAGKHAITKLEHCTPLKISPNTLSRVNQLLPLRFLFFHFLCAP